MDAVLGFVRAHGVVHPRVVDAHFAHGSSRNWFGGSSKASTQLLDDMHYRGLLRIAGRASGVRTYAERTAPASVPEPRQALDALVDVIVRKYAPLPERSFYALPLLWHEQVIGWGNVSVVGGQIQAGLGYVAGKPPPGAAFSGALDDELRRMATFLQAGASEKGEPLAKNSDGGT